MPERISRHLPIVRWSRDYPRAHLRGDVVAGLTVALALPRATVLVPEERGSTWWAQGGIAVAMAEGDDPDLHAADTVEVSGGLAVEEAVGILTEGGPQAVERLMGMLLIMLAVQMVLNGLHVGDA